jgi:hypothetical protein
MKSDANRIMNDYQRAKNELLSILIADKAADNPEWLTRFREFLAVNRALVDAEFGTVSDKEAWTYLAEHGLTDELRTVCEEALDDSALADPAEMIRRGAPRVIHSEAELKTYTDALVSLKAEKTTTKDEDEAIELLTVLIQHYEIGHPVPAG